MAVSVRMDSLLEKELEQAARRLGQTKSQFIIDAVERALGRKNPAQLYNQVMEKVAEYRMADPAPLNTSLNTPLDTPAQPPTTGERLSEKLRAQRAAHSRDWLAYQAARKQGIAWVPDDEDGAQ